MKKIYIIRTVVLIIAAAVAVTAWLGIREYFLNAPDFSLIDIKISSEGRAFKHLDRTDILKTGGLDRSPSPNIFDINLSLMKSELEAHPWVEKAELRRVLPGRLLVQVREREGMARVRITGRFFLIDSNGIVLPDVQNVPTYDYPLINVRDIGPAGSRIGTRLDLPGLKVSLKLLEELKARGFLEKYPVRAISPQGNGGIFFALTNEKIEVRMSNNEFGPKIDILEQLLLKLKDEIETVSYMDMRFIDDKFKEPVVGYK